MIIYEVTFPLKDRLVNKAEPVPTEVSQPKRELGVSPRGRLGEKHKPRGRARGHVGGMTQAGGRGPAGPAAF